MPEDILGRALSIAHGTGNGEVELGKVVYTVRLKLGIRESVVADATHAY